MTSAVTPRIATVRIPVEVESNLSCSSIGTRPPPDTIKFIRSQKKNAQLVYRGYLFNRKLTQQNGNTTWRCVEVSKNRCKAICVTKLNKLVRAKRQHNHENHEAKIRNKVLYEYPEDLEEYLEICAEAISESQKLDVIDDGTDYKLVVRDAIEIVAREDDGEASKPCDLIPAHP